MLIFILMSDMYILQDFYNMLIQAGREQVRGKYYLSYFPL